MFRASCSSVTPVLVSTCAESGEGSDDEPSQSGLGPRRACPYSCLLHVVNDNVDVSKLCRNLNQRAGIATTSATERWMMEKKEWSRGLLSERPDRPKHLTFPLRTLFDVRTTLLYYFITLLLYYFTTSLLHFMT